MWLRKQIKYALVSILFTPKRLTKHGAPGEDHLAKTSKW